ncbi:hypothetical protein [Phaeobacter gallaeciensis]|uniref:hypothetical protein n=1 Tax=Phaeobacter gallaeciensis TaxID=60890 RepID=UPI00237EFF05|nr:hypothetical protein [Phaeobacter gallaeciensis]MDE4063640.1 hypothetical protein [Phaeobacter gallaeciensis]MDE4126650.1 hypothetical protein [Phaeobacter gallaeciensis]MDE4131136.1 hypothetical protein [Phaeobacter gallaeciensis]
MRYEAERNQNKVLCEATDGHLNGRASLLIVEEISYLLITADGVNLFVILTRYRGHAELGDPFIAAALFDSLMHHAAVIQI